MRPITTSIRFPLWCSLLAAAALCSPALAASGSNKKPAKPHWDTEPYAKPEVGATAWSNGSTVVTAATLGGQAGIKYWRVGDPPPMWNGKTRARVAYVLSSANSSGLDLRLGSFMGPKWQYVGLQTGPDIFWDRWTYGSTEIPGSVGVDWPLAATFYLSPVNLGLGVTPSWLANEERRVDWSEARVPGFGHEFSYQASISLTLDSITLSLGYSLRVMASGTQQGFSVGAKLRS